MAKDNPFRVVTDTDPRLESSKAIIKQILTDMLAKVDEEDVETICFVAVTNAGAVIHGRHLIDNHYKIIGALEKQKHDAMNLLDQIDDISSETKY